MKTETRTNPLLYERDGDFNPGWLLFCIFSGLGALISVGALVVAFVAKAPSAVIAALSFIAFAMIATAAIVVPIARAKLLVSLKGAVGDVASAAAHEAGRLAGVDVRFTDDER